MPRQSESMDNFNLDGNLSKVDEAPWRHTDKKGDAMKGSECHDSKMMIAGGIDGSEILQKEECAVPEGANDQEVMTAVVTKDIGKSWRWSRDDGKRSEALADCVKLTEKTPTEETNEEIPLSDEGVLSAEGIPIDQLAEHAESVPSKSHGGIDSIQDTKLLLQALSGDILESVLLKLTPTEHFGVMDLDRDGDRHDEHDMQDTISDDSMQDILSTPSQSPEGSDSMQDTISDVSAGVIDCRDAGADTKSEEEQSLPSCNVRKCLFGSSGFAIKQLNCPGNITNSGDDQTGRTLGGQLKSLPRELTTEVSSLLEEKTVKGTVSVSMGSKDGGVQQYSNRPTDGSIPPDKVIAVWEPGGLSSVSNFKKYPAANSLDNFNLGGNLSKVDEAPWRHTDKNGDAIKGSECHDTKMMIAGGIDGSEILQKVECAVPEGAINQELMTAVVTKAIGKSWRWSRDDSKGSEALADCVELTEKTLTEETNEEILLSDEDVLSAQGIPIDQRAEHAESVLSKSHGGIDSIQDTKLLLQALSGDILESVLLKLTPTEHFGVMDLDRDGDRHDEHDILSTPSQFPEGSDSIQDTISDVSAGVIDCRDAGAVTKSEEEQSLPSCNVRKCLFGSSGFAIKQLNCPGNITNSGDDQTGRTLGGQLKSLTRELTTDVSSLLEEKTVKGTVSVSTGCKDGGVQQYSSRPTDGSIPPDKVTAVWEPGILRSVSNCKKNPAANSLDNFNLGGNLSKVDEAPWRHTDKNGDAMKGSACHDTKMMIAGGIDGSEILQKEECAVPEGAINQEVMTAVVTKRIGKSWRWSRDDSKRSEALADCVELTEKTLTEETNEEILLSDEDVLSAQGIPIDQRAEHAESVLSKSHGGIDSIQDTKLLQKALSGDILESVLLKLSPTELLKMKRVSTEWRKLISSSYFMLRHSRKQSHLPKVAGFFFQQYARWTERNPPELSYFCREREGAKLLKNSKLELIPRDCTIASTCNGIICCKCAGAKDGTWIITVGNPVNKKWIEIEWDASGKEQGITLLFDPSGDTTNFKLVMLWQRETEKGHTFYIFDSRTAIWKHSAKISAKDLVEFSVHPRSRFSIKETAYFLTDGDIILGFNVDKEEVCMIEKPSTGLGASQVACIGDAYGTDLRYVVVTPERFQVWGHDNQKEEEEQWSLIADIPWVSIQNVDLSSELGKRRLKKHDLEFFLEPLAFKDDTLVVRVGASIFCFDSRGKGGMIAAVLDVTPVFRFSPIVLPYSPSLTVLCDEETSGRTICKHRRG